MPLKLKRQLSEIITLVSGQYDAPNGELRSIENIASLEQAGPNDLGVLFDREDTEIFSPISLEKIKQSRAAVLLTSRAIPGDDRCLVVPDAIVAYEKIIALAQSIQAQVKANEPYIHETASIEPSAKIGQQVRIGAHAYVGHDCVIGDNVTLEPGVKVLDRCIVGDGSIIHAGTVIGSDGYRFLATSRGMRKVPQIGIVRIGKQVEIGANCTVDRATFDETAIEDGVKIDNLVHIAHNVRIGTHTAIIAQTGIAGGAIIGKGCQIGGQVGIKDHVTIGDGVKIVSKAVVVKDVAAGSIVAGIPAMPFLAWKRITVMVQKLPELVAALKKVEARTATVRWWQRLLGIK